MKYIRKGARPLALRNWITSNKALADAQYGSHNFPKAEVHVALAKEQGWICAYSMVRIGIDSSHVEHLKPQTKSRSEGKLAETYDYKNMVACYPSTPKPGDVAPTFGAIPRGSNWDADKFITPLAPACELKIQYQQDGHVRARRSNDAAACWTIDALHLDDGRLVELRRAAIEGWGLSLAAAAPLSRAAAARAITSTGRRNHEGMLEPFCVAIRHAADDYIGLLDKVAAQAKYVRSGKRRKSRR